MSIVENIKSLCKQRNMSIPKLEKEFNWGNGAIYNWDKNSPSADKLQKVADYFNVSLDYLLGRAEPDIKDDNIRTLARDIQDLTARDQDFLKKMIKTMSEIGKEALGK